MVKLLNAASIITGKSKFLMTYIEQSFESHAANSSWFYPTKITGLFSILLKYRDGMASKKYSYDPLRSVWLSASASHPEDFAINSTYSISIAKSL